MAEVSDGSPPNDGEQHDVVMIQQPPNTVAGIVRRLGPGLIIAASIVGSGELIMTTKTGAEAGYWLLWLVIIGCVIKVFVQIEFGRFALTQGKTSLQGMNEVPGPRLRVNWLMWYWLIMFTVGLGQLGGILGGVGQSMAMTVPITGDYNAYLQVHVARAKYDEELATAVAVAARDVDGHVALDETARKAAEETAVATLGPRPELPSHRDDTYWCIIVAVITSLLLINGRYGVIQAVSTSLVVFFVIITIANLGILQSYPAWATHWSDIRQGLRFALPPNSTTAVATALAAFGIIGVGASELVAYPYWCLEKGYARFTGPRDSTSQWAARARGWLRVMHWDAWCSMVIYTFATLAFYILGAAVLSRSGKIPSNDALIRTLADMYVPVFGAFAAPMFLVGAFAVLYSTFFVATAGNSRMAADALRVFRISGATHESRVRWVRIFSGAFPLVSLSIFILFPRPVTLVAISGLIQSTLLPMLGFAALFFRYRRCDPRVAPGKSWDVMLWLSVAGLLLAGGWGAWTKLSSLAVPFIGLFSP